ncbi:rhodanese-like domain-containing protein [Neoaquamicrobium microcysteis]|uniref:rhodanese-like domain-containing protein n=1 Tax=Neoaquamicrobium microcysteis TaxID=2682781 RepID=UPI001375AD5D|nr:rhodanese-like domain-containing protein [Mesorhizobium microcysteis]
MTDRGVVGIDACEARRRVHADREIAFLDVREAGQFGEGHALFAVPCAYSRLEAMVPGLVPRKTVPIVLVDDGDGIAERAARRLREMDYRDVATIDGGMRAWEAAGFPVYKGVNVPSKLLGELAETVWHPRMVAAPDLAAWKAQGRNFRFYDARPPAEYAKMRVPGAACLPNGELAHRLPAIGDEQTPIVITCAGRTRGIVGAIGVALTGYAGPVFALENGTQGWALSGQTLERRNTAAPFPSLTREELLKSREVALGIAQRFALETVDANGIEPLVAEDDATTYLFDVRSAAEAADDPLEGAVHAWSGQLVQATDQWVGVRHARIVLFDDSGVRAAIAAFWLRQLGYRPFVAVLDDEVRDTLGRLAQTRGGSGSLEAPGLPRIEPAQANALAASGEARIVDMRGSLAYRREHVAGAAWLVRPRADWLAEDVAGKVVCLVADDDSAAAWTAEDLRKVGAEDVRLVEGGHAALVAAGAQVTSTPGLPADADAIDHLFFVHDRHDDNMEASRRYLAWETGLITQMDAAEQAEYQLIRPD